MEQSESGDTANPGETIGGHIRRRREARGWTLESVARRAKVSVSLVSDIEHGRVNPSLRSLVGIAAALDTTARELLRDVQPYDPPDSRSK